MSLDKNSGNCEEVLVATTQNDILGDYQGAWSGTDTFRAQLSLYRLRVQNFRRSTLGYQRFMAEVQGDLNMRGIRALTSGPAENLLVWMTWQRKEPDYLFQMSGSPRVVFNREHINTGLASAAGICSLTTTHGFDFGGDRLFLQYFYETFTEDNDCLIAWSLDSQGYISTIDGPILRNDFDVTSIVTAIAVL